MNIVILQGITDDTDAWMQDEKEQSSSLTADLSRSHPDLRTIPLILTPLPDTRLHTAASVLNTRRNKVAPAAPAGTFHELRSLSPGRSTSFQYVSHKFISVFRCLGHWKRHVSLPIHKPHLLYHPLLGEMETQSSVPVYQCDRGDLFRSRSSYWGD